MSWPQDFIDNILVPDLSWIAFMTGKTWSKRLLGATMEMTMVCVILAVSYSGEPGKERRSNLCSYQAKFQICRGRQKESEMLLLLSGCCEAFQTWCPLSSTSTPCKMIDWRARHPLCWSRLNKLCQPRSGFTLGWLWVWAGQVDERNDEIDKRNYRLFTPQVWVITICIHFSILKCTISNLCHWGAL